MNRNCRFFQNIITNIWISSHSHQNSSIWKIFPKTIIYDLAAYSLKNVHQILTDLSIVIRATNIMVWNYNYPLNSLYCIINFNRFLLPGPSPLSMSRSQSGFICTKFSFERRRRQSSFDTAWFPIHS
jgi:hypothetical protein